MSEWVGEDLRDSEVVALKPKHTPGPWVAIPVKRRFHSDHKPIFDDGLWAILPEAHLERIPICEVDHADDHNPPTRVKAGADAHLISAAPDLLAVVKTRVAFEAGQNPFGHDCILGCVACMERLEAMEAAAIAKAEPK